MKKFALLIALMFSCTSEDKAIHTLTNYGFTNITITGYEPLKCSRGDSTCTGFEATSINGTRVSGAVGCGYGCGKGCTIRI